MERLVSVQDFENEAKEVLSKNAKDYFTSGADDEITTSNNTDAWTRYNSDMKCHVSSSITHTLKCFGTRWLIRPRVLRDVSIRDLSRTVLGKKVKVPLGVSPAAFQGLAHSDGECGSSKGFIFMPTY